MYLLVALLLPTARSLEEDSLEDGETYGNMFLYSTIVLSGLFLIFSFVCARRAPKLGGFTQLVLFLQLTRWSIVLDYGTPKFLDGFWGQLSYIFDPFEVVSVGDEEPDNENMGILGVTSTSFIDNSEDYVVLWILLGLFSCLAKVITQQGDYKILVWGFLVSFYDVLLFSLLQVKHLSSDELASSMLGVIGLLSYGVLGLIAIYLLVKEKKHPRFFAVLTNEFKENTRKVYYALILMSRTFIAVLIVFIDSDLQYPMIATVESLIVMYLIGVLPYKKAFVNLLAILLHILELLVMSVPVLYEDTEESFVVVIFLSTLALGIVSCFVRVFIEIAIAKRQNSRKIGNTQPIDRGSSLNIQRQESNRSQTFKGNKTSIDDKTISYDEAIEQYSRKSHTRNLDEPKTIKDKKKTQIEKSDKERIAEIKKEQKEKQRIEQKTEQKQKKKGTKKKTPIEEEEKKNTEQERKIPRKITQNASMYSKLAGVALGIPIE